MLIFLLLLIALAAFLQYWSMGHSLDGLEHLCLPTDRWWSRVRSFIW